MKNYEKQMINRLKLILFRSLLIVIILTVLMGCALPSADVRIEQTRQLASSAGWSEFHLSTGVFDLTGFSPAHYSQQSKLLTIYIEGDGLAWLSRTQVSPDPTPVNPLGLKLALQHPNDAVVYLARPCQLGQARNCAQQFWTTARFGSEVISAYDQALNQLKQQFHNEYFQLIGYSGGGAIATLVAASRTDVVQLVTVAGNLDHRVWTDYHQVSPLKKSLNPASFYRSLENIPQYHFVGGRDKIVPVAIANSYAERFPQDARPPIIIIPEADHRCCWVRLWPELYSRVPVELK